MSVTSAAPTVRRRIPGAWLVPTAVVFFGGGFGEQHAMEGVNAFGVVLAGIGAGLLWQMLSRRDLADRLTFLALCVCLGAVFLALVRSSYLLANAGPGHALAGVLAGAVLCERVMTLRESQE